MRYSMWFTLAIAASCVVASAMSRKPTSAEDWHGLECFIVLEQGRAESIHDISMEVYVRNVSRRDISLTYFHFPEEHFSLEIRDLATDKVVRSRHATDSYSPGRPKLQEAQIRAHAMLSSGFGLDPCDEVPAGLYSVVCRFECDEFKVRSPEVRIRIGPGTPDAVEGDAVEEDLE